jgi:hypothetical protein
MFGVDRRAQRARICLGRIKSGEPESRRTQCRYAWRRIMTRYVMALALFCGLAPRVASAQTPGCAPENPTRTEMVERFKVIVSATSSGAAARRAALDLPQISQDSVVALTDSATCAALSVAQGAYFSESPLAVTAIRIGSGRFAVFDKGKKQGEFESVSIYGSQYALLKRMHY